MNVYVVIANPLDAIDILKKISFRAKYIGDNTIMVKRVKTLKKLCKLANELPGTFYLRYLMGEDKVQLISEEVTR